MTGWFKPSMLRPTKKSAALDHIIVDGHLATSVRQRNLLPVENDENGVPPIVRLHLTGCPDAIALAISSVVIQALYRVPGRWTRTHVKKESREVVYPFVTNGYPSPSVSGIITCYRAMTPSPYVHPSGIFRRALSFVCGSVFSDARCHIGHARAATPKRMTVLQIAAANCPLGAAITTAKPIWIAFDLMGKSKHKPPAISLASQILHSAFSHPFLLRRIMVRGDVARPGCIAPSLYQNRMALQS
jgi:hypothetical protein